MSGLKDVDYLLEEVVSLPALPATVERVSGLIDDPDVPMMEVGKAIATDTGIAMKTLRLVNSAYYGTREKVNSVEQAAVLLGPKVIKNLVFTSTVMETFKGSGDAFFRHSVACGMAMRSLAVNGSGTAAVDPPEEASVYGVLHDVGKIILEEHLSEDYGRVGELARTEQMPWFEAERQILGVDHAEVGARLAENWRLSPEIVNAIAGHHDLANCRDSQYEGLAALLAVADYVCFCSGLYRHTRVPLTVSEDHWKAANVSSKDVPAILEPFFDSIQDVNELVQLAA